MASATAICGAFACTGSEVGEMSLLPRGVLNNGGNAESVEKVLVFLPEQPPTRTNKNTIAAHAKGRQSSRRNIIEVP
jgi:hypothetical protein